MSAEESNKPPAVESAAQPPEAKQKGWAKMLRIANDEHRFVDLLKKDEPDKTR